MKTLYQYLSAVNGFVWGMPALVLILGVGVFLSLKTRFAQIRLFPKACKKFANNLRNSDRTKGVSSYQTLCTALSATVGTGNIAGVAGAIALGGPGAVFWIWVCALLGMITKFAEATLAVFYQRKGSSGEPEGGPMYMIEHGMGKRFRWLACVYAFFGAVAAFGVGNATQVNSVLDGLGCALGVLGFHDNSWIRLSLALLLAVIVARCLLGGAKKIGSVAEKLVPFASFGYVLLGVTALVLCRDRIPHAIRSIFVGAFSPRAATGGAVGSMFLTLRTGVSRGVFTNEAGMGTASISYASATVEDPTEQGLMGIVEVFVDTIVICSITAFVILCSGDIIPYGLDEGAALTSRAFGHVLGDWVQVLIAVFLACFAFATMLGWGLYGAKCAEYLFGPSAWKCFVVLQAIVVTVSSLVNTGTIWLLSEIMNGLMAFPNLIALIALSPVLFGIVRNYTKKGSFSKLLGGTNENIYKCKSLRTISYEKISSSCSRGGAER